VFGDTDRLKEQFGGIQQIQQLKKCLNLLNHSYLPIAWAFRSSNIKGQDLPKSREIIRPVNFLLERQKADEALGSKSMMTARDSNKKHLFASSEFLTCE